MNLNDYETANFHNFSFYNDFNSGFGSETE